MDDFLNFINGASFSIENLPTFKEYAWDFDKNDFIFDGNGKMIILEGNAALEVWIRKAFKTEYRKYLAYSASFGFEGKELFGQVISVEERRAGLKQAIIDALMVNPYILSVNSVTFNQKGGDLNIEINISTIYGSLIL